MNQLILVSTPLEIKSFSDKAGVKENICIHKPIQLRDDNILLISGVGSPSTLFYLTRFLTANSFDRIIQVGVAGSYKSDIKHGTLVEVSSDCFADLGIDDKGRFTSIFDAGLSDPNLFPFKNGLLLNPDQNVTGLRMAKAVTVNTTTGSTELIEQRKNIYHPDIESMEGAAAFFVGFQLKIPVLQIRSISNFVEPRNRDAWELDMAIENLNNWLLNFVFKHNTD
jgi:futalosine hydrolase